MDFDQIYKQHNAPWSTKPNKVLADNVKLLKPDSVLDLGCGDGRHLIYLSKQGFKVTGVDLSTEAIKILEHRIKTSGILNVEVYNSHITDFIINVSGYYDNIISFFTLHFMWIPEGHEAINWMQKHTKIGGINIIKDFTVKGNMPISKNPKVLYFKQRELNSMYREWEILHYLEEPTHTRSGHVQVSAEIVARKR